MATKVKLRKKAITGNRQSLYLDFYPAIINVKGELTRREFLGLYLFNDTVLDKQGKEKKITLSPFDKEHNKETEKLAEIKFQNRKNELNKPEIYNDFERQQLRIKELGEQDFLKYFLQLSKKRKGQTYASWAAAYRYLNSFAGGELKFTNLNDRICADFRDYLLSTPSNKSSKVTLTPNSAAAYYEKFKAALTRAFEEGYIQSDLNKKAIPIKKTETQKNFLTIKELNSLKKAICPVPVLKQAALFSAYTGLRFSDIIKLAWGEIEYIEEEGYIIRFRQQKTKGYETLPISADAYSLLGERKNPTDKVFDGLMYSAYFNMQLAKWVGLAGITKDITFHCFRHSFAVLQLSSGTDIYTVSKMLGHRELKTTQVYAQVLNKAKREASEKIKLEA